MKLDESLDNVIKKAVKSSQANAPRGLAACKLEDMAP